MSTNLSTTRKRKVLLQSKSEVLLTNEKLGKTIKVLYKLEKSEQPYFSVQYMCLKAKIPSKGHLSDVMGERRTLKLEYAKPLSKVFNLDSEQAKIFVSMAKYEKARTLSDKKKYYTQLQVAKKRLKSLETSYQEVQGVPFDFSRVFCSLGIIKKPVTAKKISHALEMDITAVLSYLKQLTERGFLIESEGCYALSANEVHFSKGEFVDMIQSYLQASQLNINKWIDSKDSIFESSTISVTQRAYKELLPKFKEFVMDTMSNLETEEGDSLVHFNVQVYPDR